MCADGVARISRWLVAVIVVLTIQSAPRADQVRDRPVAPATGTAVVRGRVLLDGSNVPARGAMVTVSDAPARESWSALTADDGSFVIPVRPGRFSIVATKAGFVSGAYRATRPGRPGVQASLEPDATLDVVLRIGHGGVITGTVRDPAGVPLTARVLAIAVSAQPPDVRLSPIEGSRSTVRSTETNDRGEYRLFGLPAGDYYIVAAVSGSVPAEIGRRSAAEVDDILNRLRLRGSTQAAPAAPRPPLNVPPPAAYMLAPMFHPGTPIAGSATPVTIASGEERASIDVTFAPVPLTTIEGVLVMPDGRAPEASQILVLPIDALPGVSLGTTQPKLTQPADQNGRFVVSNVAPGRARVVVRARDQVYGAAVVQAGASPVVEITVRLQPAARLRGRVILDGSTGPSSIASDVRVVLTAAADVASVDQGADPVIGDVFVKQLSVLPAPDGTFEFQHLSSGRYRIGIDRPSDKGRRWWLQSATLPPRGDVLDALDLSLGDDVTGLTLTIADRPSSLTGTLQTASGLPAPDYHVVLFPADRALWTRRSRHARAARPAPDGSFAFDELPAGTYLLAALTDVEPDEWQRAEFLASIAPAAVAVTIAKGERKRQDLRIAR